MVIIVVPDGREWYKANWVFRQLAQDIRARFPEDVELKVLLERAEAFGILRLDTLNAALSSRAIGVINLVLDETRRGAIRGWQESHPNDITGVRQYMESLEELASMVHMGP